MVLGSWRLDIVSYLYPQASWRHQERLHCLYNFITFSEMAMTIMFSSSFVLNVSAVNTLGPIPFLQVIRVELQCTFLFLRTLVVLPFPCFFCRSLFSMKLSLHVNSCHSPSASKIYWTLSLTFVRPCEFFTNIQFSESHQSTKMWCTVSS